MLFDLTQREGVLEAQLADKAERLGALEKREADLLSQLMEAEKGPWRCWVKSILSVRKFVAPNTRTWF